MEKARKGGKKNRKHGRQQRRNSGKNQPARTARNKAKRMFHEEQKAGRRLEAPKDPMVAIELDNLRRIGA